jgi:hypothetical protein
MDERIAKEKNSSILSPPPGWPRPLGKHAMCGLLGDIVGSIGPHTEADPAALAFQTLTAFGNLVGPGPHFSVEADKHSGRLSVTLVGSSSRARKGTSRGYVLRLLRLADKQWARECVQSGLASGEGLVEAVAKNVESVQDGRLCIVEDELSSDLRVMLRFTNTLSPVLRNAWDGRPLQVMTREAPLRVTDAHVSVIAHITQHDLERYLGQTELFNGFANRFLWVCVRRSKLLPDGGRIGSKVISSLAQRLKESFEFARNLKEVGLSRGAGNLWHKQYAKLTEDVPGLVGAVTSRAEAQVRRMALIYALINQSSTVRTKHLRAALEAWRYCADSALYIFGARESESVENKILAALLLAGEGLTRTQINAALHHHTSKSDISRALEHLKARGLVHKMLVETAGRPAERWHTNAPQEDRG